MDPAACWFRNPQRHLYPAPTAAAAAHTCCLSPFPARPRPPTSGFAGSRVKHGIAVPVYFAPHGGFALFGPYTIDKVPCCKGRERDRFVIGTEGHSMNNA